MYDLKNYDLKYIKRARGMDIHLMSKKTGKHLLTSYVNNDTASQEELEQMALDSMEKDFRLEFNDSKVQDASMLEMRAILDAD